MDATLWLSFEVMAMYLYIASACIFLFMISFVGLLGNGKKMDIKGDRYKYDAVEYYKTDLDWFALIFIGFAMDSMVIGLVTSGIYKTSDISDQFVLVKVGDGGQIFGGNGSKRGLTFRVNGSKLGPSFEGKGRGLEIE